MFLLLFFCFLLVVTGVIVFVLEYLFAARCPGAFAEYALYVFGKNHLALN